MFILISYEEITAHILMQKVTTHICFWTWPVNESETTESDTFQGFLRNWSQLRNFHFKCVTCTGT